MKKSVLIITSVLLIISILSVNAFALTPTYEVSDPYKNGIYYKRLCDVNLTGNYADDLIAVAMSQKGYHEGNDKNEISGESNGNSNYTEFCDWYGKRVSWCALFISWCARQARIPESIISTNSNAAGTECNYGENKVGFNQYTPRAGDIIYVDSKKDGISNHVGLIKDVDENYIYTIEGNKKHEVREITYYREAGTQTNDSSVKIVYYGVPDYNLDYLLGDVNADGKINSSGALMILNYCVGNITLISAQKERADINKEKCFNSTDALIVLIISVNS